MRSFFGTAPRTRARKILVVDDDAAVRDTIKDRLAYHGWDIMIASDGQEALALAARNKPEIILLDIHMPGMDGLIALENLRSRPDLSSVPVVMVTASNRVSDITRAASCNVVDYITKPFNAAELIARVEQVLQHVKS